MMIAVVQIMAILYLMFAIRFKIWRVSLNTFLVLVTFAVIVISREVEFLHNIWIQYHLTIIAGLMTVMVVRVWAQRLCKIRKCARTDCKRCLGI